MRALDDDGVELHADFVIETVGNQLTLVIESAGNAKSSGRARNVHYVPLLLVLLERLKRLNAVLLDGEVDSRETAHLPQPERRLHLRGRSYPVSLADEANIEDLRLAITGAQRGIGRPDGATAGNSRRRMRLALAVPGFGLPDVAELAATLVAARESAADQSSTTEPNATMTTFRLRPVEQAHTARTAYDRLARSVIVSRAESALVHAYLRWLGPADATRSETSAGITDIHLDGGVGAEIIEAKSRAGHQHCRIALGQLLDYAAATPVPIDRLTGLFPARPGDAEVSLLHQYGIDCVFPEDRVFVRLEAPDHNRERMRPIWNASGAT